MSELLSSKNDIALLDSIANWFENHPNVDLDCGGIELLRQYRDGLRDIVARGAVETTALQWRPVGDEPRDTPLLCHWLPIDRYGQAVTSTATHSSIGDGWHRPERGSDSLRTPAYWMLLPEPPRSAPKTPDDPHADLPVEQS